jgi:hypothetical protein
MKTYIKVALGQMIGDSKYLQYYCSIINNIKKQRTSKKQCKEMYGWCEAHHIIPVSFDLSFSKDRNNLVYCTPREHFILHRLLYRASHNTVYLPKARSAVIMFMKGNKKQNRTLTSRHYQFLRELAYHNAVYNNILSRKGESNPFYGKKHTEETKQKIREKNTRTLWERVDGDFVKYWETKKRMAESRATWSIPCSEEKKKSISKKNSMKLWINNGAVEERLTKGEKLPDGWVYGRLYGKKYGSDNHFSKGLTRVQIEKAIKTKAEGKYKKSLYLVPIFNEVLMTEFSFYHVAKKLNEIGVTTLSGCKWQYSTVKSAMVMLGLTLRYSTTLCDEPTH